MRTGGPGRYFDRVISRSAGETKATASVKVPFFKSSIDESDIDRVSEVLRTNFLTTGPVTAELEAELAKYCGTAAGVGVMSCTSAMHLCLTALGIGQGDEVITTPMSFVATANVISHVGARPVFVDVEPGTGNLDASKIEAAITPATRAIMPVHLYGQLCDMKAIAEIAARHGLQIVEDAAHAIEGQRDRKGIGAHSAAACVSFYATKNITAGEGGAILTNDEELAAELKQLRLHGMSADAADRYTGLYRHYDVTEAGWKCNLSDAQAALALGQLLRIDRLLEKRTAAYDRYEVALGGMRGIELMERREDSRHSCHLFTIRVDPEIRDAFLHGLQEREIGVAVNFRPIHLMEYYRRAFGFKEGSFPVAEEIGASTISLPLHPRITEAEQDAVIEAAIGSLL